MDELEGRTAVVTGAASGIGLALATAFANEGMNVVLADVDDEGLVSAATAISTIGVGVTTVRTDVADPEQVDALRDAAVAAFGTTHVICNNAGVSAAGFSWEVPLESWKWVFGVNFWGVVHGIRSFVPLMREQGVGHVVNTASAAGLISTPYLGPYSVTKHAVVSLSETLALELRRSGVGVSVLCPMWVKTRIHESDRNAPPEVVAVTEAPQAARMREFVGSVISGGLEPSYVAEMVVDAVKTDAFYILPHEEVRSAARTRGERIAEGQLPEVPLFTSARPGSS